MRPADGRPSTVGRDDSVTRGSSSFSGDPEKGGIEDPHPLSPHASSRKSSKFTPWRKYNSLNPLRWRQPPPVPHERQISKEADASIWSKATLSWMGDLMKTGYLRPLEPTDIPLVAPHRSTSVITPKIQESFRRRRERGDKYPLLWALNEVFFWEWWYAGACRVVADVLLIMNPYLLKYLIRFAVQSYYAKHAGVAGPKVGRGVGLAVGVACIQMFVSIAVSQFMYYSMMVGGQARASLIGMIFDKSLLISGRAKAGGDAAAAAAAAAAALIAGGKQGDMEAKKGKSQDDSGWSNGRVVNLMGTDSFRVDLACGWFHVIWSSPIQIVIALILLIVNLSYSALAGFALLMVGIPLLSWVVKVLAAKRKTVNKITDKRVALTQEIFTGVRFVKYFGWEESFLSRLQDLRNREIRAVQFLLGVRSGVTAVGISMPVFASMLAFITYSLTDNSLDPAAVFSSLALFNTLRMPLNLLPVVIAQTTDAWVSLQRLQEYFCAEEITDRVEHDKEMAGAIEVIDGSFTWEESPPDSDRKQKKGSRKERRREAAAAAATAAAAAAAAAVSEESATTGAAPATATPTTPGTPIAPFHLEGINLSVSRNELVAIVGSVGCGKSSLLAAIAGDMRKTSGAIRMSSRLAYCPQYAWIQNATVRENIIFGKDFDPAWYADVVEACALQADLDMLPDGDMTEIGERGITISGGQKQRVNIARAIYFDADIVLMDDPLSAVDAHVGKHLFDKAICGLLRDKCRLLATHQLHVLEKVDRVVWMEDGQIQAVGTFPELMDGNPAFAEMMSEISTEKVEDSGKVGESEESDGIEEGGGQEQKGGPVQGKALMQVEERSIKSVPWKVYEAYIKASGTWLNMPLILLLLGLGQAGNIVTTLWLSYWTSDKYHLSNGVYIGVFAALGAAQSILMFGFAFSLTLAGTNSSKVLMQKAMKSALRAPMSFFDTTPLGRIVNRFSKDVDVMDNQLTDAIRMYLMTLAITSSVFILIIVYFSYFAIALFPLAVLFIFSAAYYRASAREVKRHESVLRSHVYAKFGESLSGTASIRAYGLESRFSDTINKAIDEMNGAYFITFSNQRWLSVRLDVIGNLLVFTTAILVVTSRFTIHPSISGVVLSYILQIVMILQWMIRQLAEVENSMNATERIHYYGTELPEEAALRTDAQVPPTWPEHGAIEFRNVSMRYRPGLPLVLKDLSLAIPGGSRVGIVGRTGAGKSSITVSLFRLTELASGSILIDGVDIARIGLATLRSKLSIIPQDPTLFKGTVRTNLDPFQQHSDAALLSALHESYLDSAITLDTAVEEDGYNFSLGQRQQIALARALVRGSRVVVADEATSSVDVETDKVIQRSMKEGFRGRTLVCIAHRLRTVVGYDLVVVMDGGEVVEMGEPGELWRRRGTWFGMCERSGISEKDFEKRREQVGEKL